MFQVPNEGFANSAEFVEYLKKINAEILEDYREYLKNGDKFRLKDPVDSGRYRAHIIMECADGRNSVTLFVPSDYMLNRFNIEWLPFAGNIVFPEFSKFEVLKDWDDMRENVDMMHKFFDRLDFLFGTYVEEALQEYKEGKLASVFIEFQSHFDSHDETHGCGAHKSNLLAAQLETIKDSLITTEWVKNRYPQEFEAGIFKIFRTTHDTVDGGPIYAADAVDKSRLSGGDWGAYAELFDYAEKNFKPPVFVDALKSLVRLYQGNPYEIDLAKHDEQVVRVSNVHFASMLSGQSSMEIAWSDSAETVAAHVKVLLSIIENNFRARHQDKPVIIHFDLVKGNERMRRVYDDVMKILVADQEVQQKKEDGLLSIVTTETDRKTYELDIVN